MHDTKGFNFLGIPGTEESLLIFWELYKTTFSLLKPRSKYLKIEFKTPTDGNAE